MGFSGKRFRVLHATAIGSILLVVLLSGCTLFGGTKESTSVASGDSVREERPEIYVRVTDDRPARVRNLKGDPSPASMLESKIVQVLENLKFRADTTFVDQHRHLVVDLETLQFESSGEFGQVSLVGRAAAECDALDSRYRTNLSLRRTLSPDTLEEARRNPARVRQAELTEAVGEILQKLFRDTKVVRCLEGENVEPIRRLNP